MPVQKQPDGTIIRGGPIARKGHLSYSAQIPEMQSFPAICINDADHQMCNQKITAAETCFIARESALLS